MTKQIIKDAWLDFIYHFVYISKVVLFQVALVLMILGVFYIGNFKVSITPNVTIISPIVEEIK